MLFMHFFSFSLISFFYVLIFYLFFYLFSKTNKRDQRHNATERFYDNDLGRFIELSHYKENSLFSIILIYYFSFCRIVKKREHLKMFFFESRKKKRLLLLSLSERFFYLLELKLNYDTLKLIKKQFRI